MIEPLASYWMAAARSGYAKPSDWQSWADAAIERCDAPDGWLIDVSLSPNLAALERSLAGRLQRERSSIEVDATMDDATLGYFWLRYERGELNLAECLELSANVADSGSASTECESIFALLNDLEQAANPRQAATVTARSKPLFAPMTSMASSQWKVLTAGVCDASKHSAR